ncbi:MAG: hypothetical protein WAX69_08695 [Victivallales bacterium]
MKGKIVLIGAGIAMFSRGLVADIVKRRMDCEIRLVDIDEKALRVAEKLSLKMVATAKCRIEIKASTGRRDDGTGEYGDPGGNMHNAACPRGDAGLLRRNMPRFRHENLPDDLRRT